MTIDRTPQATMWLMTWLSPVFPVGAFSYSHGLEAAIADKLVTSREELKDWLGSLIRQGSIRNDCIFLSMSSQAENLEAIRKYAELAEAMAGSSERHLETMTQGKAFMDAAQEWFASDGANQSFPLPVALGTVVRSNAIDVETAIIAYLQSFTSNQIQAALRLMPLGQKNGLWIQRQLESDILAIAAIAANATIEDFGSNTVIAEIMAMQHETLQPRIFRT